MKRKAIVATRLNKTEEAAFEGIMRIEKRGRSETLREIIRQRARQLGIWPESPLEDVKARVGG